MSQVVQLVGLASRRRVTSLLAEETPHLAGYGTWDEVARPLRPGVLEWTGQAVKRLTLVLLLDGWDDGTSVEPECRTLEQFAGGRSEGRPPESVMVSGPVPASGRRWYVENLDWGDAIWQAAGRSAFRVRQHVTVTLAEDTPLATTISRVKNTGRAPRVVVVGKGMDGRKLAQKYLSNPARWKEITSTKGKRFRDPSSIKPGMRVRIPRA